MKLTPNQVTAATADLHDHYTWHNRRKPRPLLRQHACQMANQSPHFFSQQWASQSGCIYRVGAQGVRRALSTECQCNHAKHPWLSPSVVIVHKGFDGQDVVGACAATFTTWHAASSCKFKQSLQQQQQYQHTIHLAGWSAEQPRQPTHCASPVGMMVLHVQHAAKVCHQSIQTCSRWHHTKPTPLGTQVLGG
jgi:hypothetical protein